MTSTRQGHALGTGGGGHVQALTGEGPQDPCKGAAVPSVLCGALLEPVLHPPGALLPGGVSSLLWAPGSAQLQLPSTAQHRSPGVGTGINRGA